MGEWDTLICSVPVSTRPIMTTAPASMQIVINRLLRSFCITKGPPLVERRAHRQVLFLSNRLDAHKRTPVRGRLDFFPQKVPYTESRLEIWGICHGKSEGRSQLLNHRKSDSYTATAA
jgi:hypothetical protein